MIFLKDVKVWASLIEGIILDKSFHDTWYLIDLVPYFVDIITWMNRPWFMVDLVL